MSNHFTPATAAIDLKKIELVSDGTIAGTILKVNGEVIKDLRSVSIDASNGNYYKGVSAYYRTGDLNADVKDGMLAESKEYYLVKRDEDDANASAQANQSPTAHHASREGIALFAQNFGGKVSE